MAKGQSTILVAYGSNSGNTRLVAGRIGARLEQHGFSVTVKDIYRMKPSELQGYDVVVFGSCTWSRWVDGQELEAQLPEHVHRFAEAAAETPLPGTRFAIFALGRHEYNGFAGAANHLEILVHKLGGPLLLEPFKFDGFPQRRLETVDEWADQLAAAIAQPTPA